MTNSMDKVASFTGMVHNMLAILKMENIKAVTTNLPETPANSRWNHKNIENYEGHVRHGVLSTIKVPKQQQARNRRGGRMGGHGMNGIKLPEGKRINKMLLLIGNVLFAIRGYV